MYRSSDGKFDIKHCTLPELEAWVASLGERTYRARQIMRWVYEKEASSFEVMTELPRSLRDRLDSVAYISHFSVNRAVRSSDGTQKFLFTMEEGSTIESVLIPEKNHHTICVSTQLGCALSCVFCLSGKRGLVRNLSVAEMINQIYTIKRDFLPKAATVNIVFMGMGEPLANTENVLKSIEVLTSGYGYGISPSRITVSSIGMLPGLELLLSATNCHLAISLHSPFEEERLSMMPVEKIFPARRVIEFLKNNRVSRQQRISFEYIMFKGMNDTARHINGLTRLLNGLRCRVNLIRFHPIPGVALEPSDEDTIQWFKNRLNEKGILTTIRASRGKDIFAACGMLSTHHQVVTGNANPGLKADA
jgi:23S rRNA (adenine2503-C2)-methyltransferase